jgi:hypothetical protein
MNFPRMRKVLSAPGLLKKVRACFERIPGTGDTVPDFPLTDQYLSAHLLLGSNNSRDFWSKWFKQQISYSSQPMYPYLPIPL